MKNCTSCEAPLFTAVPHCPFCGTATGQETVPPPAAAAPQAAVAPEAVAPPPRPAAAATVQARATAAAAPPVPAPSLVAASPASVTPPPVPPPPVPPPQQQPRSWGKILVGVVLVLGVLSYLGRKPAQDDTACNAAFDMGTKLIASGDLAGARAQSLQAHALCVNTARPKADTLQAALADAEKAGNVCVRSLNAIGSQFEDRLLNTARNNLDQLGSSCTAMPAAGKLRQDLAQAQAGANAALQSARQAIATHNIADARRAVEQLAGFNREAAELGRLNADLDKLQSEIDAAAQAALAAPAAPPAAVAAAPQPVPIAPQPSAVEPRPAKTEPANNAKAEMAQSFLRDAEAAMSQRKFDAARTYLDSARRMDPSNPRLESLAQQIRERERQLLQQETTIR